MSLSVTDERPQGGAPFYQEPNDLTEAFTISSWLLTRDHKRIALVFFVSNYLLFFIGGFAATLMRLNLAVPGGLL